MSAMRTRISLIRRTFIFIGIGALVFGMATPSNSAPAAGKREEFFESTVRPLLAKNCIPCHNDLKSGGLQIDSREHFLKGGKDGPVIVAGDPDHSLLVK